MSITETRNQGIVMAATTIAYFWSSSYFTAKQMEPRRRSQELARKEVQVRYDTMGGWNAVSYFNRIAYEQERYSSVVGLHLAAQLRITLLYYIAWALEDFVMELGLIGAGSLVIYQIVNGIQKVGSFAMLMMYWGTFTGRFHLPTCFGQFVPLDTLILFILPRRNIGF